MTRGDSMGIDAASTAIAERGLQTKEGEEEQEDRWEVYTEEAGEGGYGGIGGLERVCDV